MARKPRTSQTFNVCVVGQHGRLSYEALLFAASLRHTNPDFQGRVLVMEPQAGPLWRNDPSIKEDEVRGALADLGAEIIPFECKHFGFFQIRFTIINLILKIFCILA